MNKVVEVSNKIGSAKVVGNISNREVRKRWCYGDTICDFSGAWEIVVLEIYVRVVLISEPIIVIIFIGFLKLCHITRDSPL